MISSQENAEAEEFLLSCCLLDGVTTFGRVLELRISPTMFALPANRLIFSRLIAMHADGKPIELASLTQEMQTAKELETVGLAYLVQISGRVPTTARVDYFAEKVREAFVLREITSAAERAIDACTNYSGQGVAEVLTPIVSQFLALSAGQQSTAEPNWRGVIKQAEAVAQSIINQKGKPAGRVLEFPWHDANSVFEPMQRGQLVIVAARPSVGKSSLLRPIAGHCAAEGKRVYMATLEVKSYQIALQLAATKTRVGVRALGAAHQADQAVFMQTLATFERMDFHVYNADRSVGQIIARAKSLHAQKPVDLILVDYLGLVEDCDRPQRGETKVSAIGRVTKAFKRLAGELDCVVIVAAQLNRASAEDNREPRLTDLRDSGDIEQDADKVLLIHRPSSDEISGLSQKDTDSKNEVPRFYQKVIQAKGRDDGTGIVGFYFSRATASFEAISKK